MRKAMANGVTPEELGELITHLAFYASWPNASAAAIFSSPSSIRRTNSNDRDHCRDHRSSHVVDNGVAVLTLSNPERRNAMNWICPASSWQRLTPRWLIQRWRRRDHRCAACVLRRGRPLGATGTNPARLKTVYAGFLAVAECPLPRWRRSRRRGGAGLNLALACDLRLAGPAAKFDARFMQLGLHPAAATRGWIDRALGTQGGEGAHAVL